MMFKNHLITILCFGLLFFSNALLAEKNSTNKHFSVSSPDKQITVLIDANDGIPSYSVTYKDKKVLHRSKLGMQFKSGVFPIQDLGLTEGSRNSVNKEWRPVWGTSDLIQEKYNELMLHVSHEGKVKFNIRFRAFDDGFGFRYEFPDTADSKQLTITDELTEFSVANDFMAWWIPAYRDQRFEYQFLHSAAASIDIAHTPVVFEKEGVAMAIHEAALVDFPSMTIEMITDNHRTFKANLVPWKNGDRAYVSGAFNTPWRMIQIADKAFQLVDSNLMLNLNEPMAENTNTDFIKPGKYMGIWWEMHIGLKEWGRGDKQGATTERAKTYIDFAAEHDIDGVLIEGWNTGWDGKWWALPANFNFTQPVEGFDMTEVNNYAKSKGVELIGHHETLSAISKYEAQMDAAFDYYQDLSINIVKMGYVGTRVEDGEWHHGQFKVRHFQKVVETAAAHEVMVNAHETVKDTGLSRTYPNLMTREVLRGMEYNGGSPDGGNLPNHTTIIPFTRGLAGPIDFTPGVFNFDYQENRPNNRVPTTLAKQLALYVVIYSPLQMAADLPENYEGHPAFQFIDDVPTEWSKSQTIDGEIGKFIISARKDKHSEDWYLGAITNENARELTIPLNFLDKGKRYKLTLYKDAQDAHWRTNPEAYAIEVINNSSYKDELTVSLQPGGGVAVRIEPL